ncbi:TIGR03086 family metal-binding protein [Micromonospora rubida]|uniref:TIGR03086 family metal-binding protein n=1 Tax=Micromonospora rubida TaxID=2697657 RepID=UPI001376B225|nr:TIGR03086 family metal-binding protein [Micromonospora rubida]NBE82627.1 TIGR03086 family protein [Micromonospora rubida]
MATKTSELLSEAAPRAVAVVRALHDDQLDLPTPCADYSVRDLMNHLYQVVVNFQELAAKRPANWDKTDYLTDGWRDRFAAETERLIGAWADPAALEGVSPGMGLPPETVGEMGLIDLTVHAWDLARATGQPFDAAPDVPAVLHAFMDRMGDTGQQMGAFAAPVAAPVAAPPDASPLDRALARMGRHPAWSPR